MKLNRHELLMIFTWGMCFDADGYMNTPKYIKLFKRVGAELDREIKKAIVKHKKRKR
jgi:RNA:NAD 2'-phosphotransferase (TPT1/KptA family)